MTFLRCFKDEQTSTIWQIIVSILIILYFLTFLYSIYPLIKYWRRIKTQPPLNMATRIGFSFILLIKCIFLMIALCIGKFFDYHFSESESESYNMKKLSVFGLVFLEFPCYFDCSLYTLVILSWLSLCLGILPFRYNNTFKISKILIIVYHITFYGLFLSAVIIEITQSGSETLRNTFSGILAVTRDFLLFVSFIIFVLFLRKGFQEDTYAESSREEKFLVVSSLVVAIFLLLRGLFSLVQGYVFFGKKVECNIQIIIPFFLSEFVCEYFPITVLLYESNKYFKSQTDIDLSMLQNSFEA